MLRWKLGTLFLVEETFGGFELSVFYINRIFLAEVGLGWNLGDREAGS